MTMLDHVGVQIGSMRGDDIGLHTKTQEEAHERRGEIAATGATHKTGIVIKGEQKGETMFAEKLGHDFQQGLSIELGPDLPMQPDGGACIHKVDNFHHVLYCFPSS